jgi:hypothetical protein
VGIIHEHRSTSPERGLIFVGRPGYRHLPNGQHWGAVPQSLGRKNAHPEFCRSINEGKLVALGEVLDSLFS